MEAYGSLHYHAVRGNEAIELLLVIQANESSMWVDDYWLHK